MEIEIQKFKAKLIEQRAEILASVETGAAAAQTVELDQSRVGRLSRMDALQAQAMSVETNRRRELHLSRITSALARIDAGEYGNCLSCGDPIDGNRLAFDPAALRCIDCAE